MTYTLSPGRIDDAWRDVMCLCVRSGYDYIVERGSYEGQIRKQLEMAMVVIEDPGKRPLAPIMPPGIPAPTSDEKIEKYFLDYIIGDELHGNEMYTYGSFIAPQLPRAIEILNSSNGNSNQACIAIGDVKSIAQSDPPCLRTIDFKVVNGKLNMIVFFRSWDLFAGFPENLGGLQLLKEYVLAHLNFECSDGSIIAYSSGLHIYEQYFDLVDMLSINKISVDVNMALNKRRYGFGFPLA